jgi:succinate dehydrogenase/fumarate reductase cytochrome b subunit
MQPFVLYSLSGVAIAVFFVATIFTEKPESAKVRWVRYAAAEADEDTTKSRHRDPIEVAAQVVMDNDSR